MNLTRYVRAISFPIVLAFWSTGGFAAPVSYSGNNTFDADTISFLLTFTTAGSVTAQSIGYGGSLSPAVAPGGFATSLSLYELNDAFGTQLAHDYLGGTAVGPGCSNGARQDPTTHLCEDALISAFPVNIGTYLLILSEQGNDGPDPLSSGYALSAGQNFSPGPFIDPGLPGNVQRTGAWALQITLTGTATQSELLSVPEPASLILLGLGLASLGLGRMRQRRRLFNNLLQNEQG
jgi:hypothetical protein